MNDRQRKRKRQRRRHASMRGTGIRMHLESALPATASPAAHLGLEIRNRAEATLCCMCGRRPFWYRVVRWDPEHPKIERIDGPEGERFPHAVIVHKHDCPAAHPSVDAALRAAYT